MRNGLPEDNPASLTLEIPGSGRLIVRLAGRWKIDSALPSVAAVSQQLGAHPDIKSAGFDCAAISNWDSGLLIFLNKALQLFESRKIAVDKEGLPRGVHRLIELAHAVPPKKDTGRHGELPPLVNRIGQAILDAWQALPGMVRETGALMTDIIMAGRTRQRKPCNPWMRCSNRIKS